jgi:hypothetical protein
LGAVEELSAVHNRLVHALHGRAGRTKDDDEVQQPWLGPSVAKFLLQDFEFLRAETFDFVISAWILCEYSA